jgi:hypothetical protein
VAFVKYLRYDEMVPTLSGVGNTNFQDGDDGSAAIPLIPLQIPPQTFTEGTPATVSLLPYLEQPTPKVATFAIQTSGGVAGVTLDGTDLVYSGTGTGSGNYTLSASLVSPPFTVVFPAFSVTANASIGLDTLAPPIPVGPLGSAELVSGDPVVTVSCYPVGDMAVAGQNVSGMKEIEVYRNGVLHGVIPVAAGSALRLTERAVGSPFTAGQLIQSGLDYTIIGGGAGIGSTADECHTGYASVTGDFFISGLLESVTGAVASVSTSGFRMTPVGGAANERAVIVFSSTAQTRTRTRFTPGATTSPSTALVGTTWPIPFLAYRIGTTVTTMVRIGDNYQQVDSDEVALGDAVDVQPFSTLGQSGAGTVTAVYRQLNIVTGSAARLVYLDTTADFSQTYTYTFKARDLAGNVSAASAAVSVTTPEDPTPPAGTLKVAMDAQSGSIAPGVASGNTPTVVNFTGLGGTKAFQFYLSRFGSSTSYRTEFHLANTNAAGKAPYNVKQWWGWSCWLPTGYNSPASIIWECIAQWHATEDTVNGVTEPAIQPPISLNIEDGQFKFTVRGDARQSVAPGTSPQSTRTATFPILINQRMDFVMEVVQAPLASPKTGMARLWMNGILRTTDAQFVNIQTGYNDVAGWYAKFGMYKGWRDDAVPDNVTERTVLIRNIRCSYDAGDNGYDLVNPRTYAP